jgi:anion-transporting  ArsA/GET3 family ATPase
MLDRLFATRVVVLSGKGGVGKSVVGAALALAAAERGRRTLLVEVDAPLEATRYLGAPPSGSRESEVRQNLFSVNLDPEGVMQEYVRDTVKVELVARKILDSPIYERFFAAAPGLKELMVLGKIMVLEEATDGWSKKPRWDFIVVDAPATGHGLAFLKVPLAASNAVPVGPIGTNARRILAMLRDPARAALLIVAMPEEMAVVEAAWFHRLATEQVGIACAGVVLNAAHEPRFSEQEEAAILRLGAAGAEGRLARDVELAAALSAARRHIRRRKLTHFYQARIKRALPLPLVTLPFLFGDRITRESLRVLGERFEAA